MVNCRMNRSSGVRVFAFALLCLSALAQPAAAQTSPAEPSVYVAITGFGDIRQLGSSASPYYPPGDESALDASGIGGGLRVGTFLHPRWSLELGVDTATRETVDLEDPVVILIFPPVPRPDLKASTSFTNVSTTLGFHPAAMGRVRVAYRAGFSFVKATYKTEYSAFLPTDLFPELRRLDFASFAMAPIQSRVTTLTQRRNSGALTLGFEVGISVTEKITVVPEVRALAFTGVFLIRPGVGLRWSF